MDTSRVIGVDEANFSPSLAGDCVIVALYAIERVEGVTDSKKLSKKEHKRLFAELQDKSVYHISLANVNNFPYRGISDSRNFGIIESVHGVLEVLPPNWRPTVARIQLDGNYGKKWMKEFRKSFNPLEVDAIVRGDSKIYEIGAASIIARVYADALFEGWNKFWPGYRLNQNHGSPDSAMYEALREKGPSPMHRTRAYAKKWWSRIMKGKC